MAATAKQQIGKGLIKAFKKENYQEIANALFGLDFPRNIKNERAVIGAILMDKKAMPIVQRILEEEDFYTPVHQYIYRAMLRLEERREPIDLITVANELESIDRITQVGGASALMECTNVVASAANLEYHARILKQLSTRRKHTIEYLEGAKDMLNMSKDVFDTADRVRANTQVVQMGGLLKRQGFNVAMEQGKDQAPRKMLMGSLLYTGQVAIMFGPSGTGKSILAVQLADALTKGKDTVSKQLRNECEPMKVLYIDFELTEQDILGRYSNEGTEYEFDDEMLLRYTINPDFLDIESPTNQTALMEIESIVCQEEPEVIIVDNLTFLTNDDMGEAKIAGKIVKKLLSIKRRYNKTMLIIGHTPKISSTEPIEKGHLRGSGILSDLIDKLFALNTVAHDPAMIYVKDLKARNSPKIYDENNVLLLQRQCTGTMGQFLSWTDMGTGREMEQLGSFLEAESQDDFVKQAIELRITTGKSFKAIAKEVGWTKSSEMLRIKVNQFVEGSTQYELQEEGRKKFIVRLKATDGEGEQNEEDPKMTPTSDEDLNDIKF